jgi:hypothetical protein
MKVTSALSFTLAFAAGLTSAFIIPEGSPDGLYTFQINSTGHEVMTYYGQPEVRAGRFSKLARDASGVSTLAERQSWSATCGTYTNIDYQPAVDAFANACGTSKSFSGSIAYADGQGVSASLSLCLC